MSELQEHEKRVVIEHRDLAERTLELLHFTRSVRFDNLMDSDKIILINQLNHMNEYLKCLAERIGRFNH